MVLNNENEIYPHSWMVCCGFCCPFLSYTLLHCVVHCIYVHILQDVGSHYMYIDAPCYEEKEE